MNKFFSFLNNIKYFIFFSWKNFLAPIFVFVLLIMIVLPLPPFLLDFLFTFNISLSVIILLVTMFTKNILKFSGFPVILLFITLLRVFLNIASARAILLYGHNGTCAVGKVIESFGFFLVGGNFSIGILIFIILVIINFMVITKGAERVAEVNARFILDGMPGKQMSIDSDLNSNIIDSVEAKKKRKKISQEADFYGSMDGASKFIRGDAIAGIFILIINIFGGLIIGIIQHGLTLIQAFNIYTILTIGDGLVSQIPSLIMSTAAGIIVTRVNYKQDLSIQIIKQLFYNPKVMFFGAVLIGIFGLIPGMPNFCFLFFSLIMMFIFYNIKKNKYFNKKKNKDNNFINISWKDIKFENIIRVELGENLSYLLVNKKKKKKFLYLINKIRKKISDSVGFLPPKIYFLNNFNLDLYSYSFYIKGVQVAEGKIFFDSILAVDTGFAKKNIFFKKNIEPAFGLSAFWVKKSFKNFALKSGYKIIDSKSIIIKHLNYIIIKNIHELLGREEVKNIINIVNQHNPKFTKDLIPKLITLTTFHIILKKLLYEKIFIKDIYTIIESLLEFTNIKNGSINDLVSFVRISLGKYITQTFFLKYKKIQVIGLSNILENFLLKIIKKNDNILMNIDLTNCIIEQTKIAIFHQIKIQAPLVLLVHHKLRFFLSNFLRIYFSNLSVLSIKEIISNKKIHITSFINFEI